MSNVIGFLETMGQDASLRHATQGEVELKLAQMQLDPDLQAAILSKDQQRLEAVLGAETNVCCGLHPSKDDEDEPMRDDDEITEQPAIRLIASAA
ncbi:MAG: hypothetical protein ABI365_07205 [Lysobacteraceae bacterium]